MNAKNQYRLHVIGWVLFIICALLFIYDSIQNASPMMVAASVVFLLASICFIIPLLMSKNS